MKIIGYSERGIVNSLFYEIYYSEAAELLLEKLLSRARFPFLDETTFCVSDVEILIEQSFSDFGDADALLLINTGKKAVSVFLEAKVKPTWKIDKEFKKFIEGIKTEVNSSNLFTQLYYKVRMVDGLREVGIPGLQKGLKFPKSFKKQKRKIGNNSVVLKAAEKLKCYLEETYYIAILPEKPDNLKCFFKNWKPPEDCLGWNACSYGYLSWSDVKVFCTENNLWNTLRVFKFNEGQIFEEKNMEIKQVVVTGQNQVELQNAEIDDKNLGPNELLIETEFTFISAGTELANYTGKEPQVFQPGTWCAYPWCSGYANVGIVRAIGNSVTRAKPGDQVFTYGNHASAIRYNETRLLIQVPENIEPSIAAASRMAGVATTAVIVGEIGNNPWVIVFGLGTVGNLASQAFRIRGCRVIGVDPVEARRNLAEQCGISCTVGGEPEEVQKSIEAITESKMGNITVDAVGHSSVVMQALKATADYGQLIILGTPRVSVHGDLTELLSDVHQRWITIRGALEWCLPMYSGLENIVSQYSKQQMIFDWIHRGELNIEPLISHCLKPEQIKEAYDGLLNEPETYTGVVLDWM